MAPAKHTSDDFNERQAIGLVSAWISETKRAMPDLKANDKWPNTDGHIELVDHRGIKMGEFKVQVKKLGKKKAEEKKFSFKSSKFLDYCRNFANWESILFIGVDLDNKKAYWLHISTDFLNKVGNKKTINFIETQVIESGNYSFIEDWEGIIGAYKSKLEEFVRLKKTFDIISDIATPALGKYDEKFITIHYFIDQINNYLDGHFSIVKQIYYPETWKLGFAYYQYEEKKVIYTLYPIALDKNDVQIKEVNRSLHEKIQKEGLNLTGHLSENPIEKRPKEYAKEIVKSKTLQLLEKRLLKHSGNEFLAKEFIFAFIDKFHIQMGLKQKNKYSIKEIEKAFYNYLPLWLQIAHKILLEEDRNNFKNRLEAGSIKYFDPDRISEIRKEERGQIQKKVKNLLKKKAPISQIPGDNEKMPFAFFSEFFNYLKQTKKEIERPYMAKDFSRLEKGGGWIWSVFSKEDAEKNLKIFFEHLLPVYENFVRSNFPTLEKELSLFGEASMILVSSKFKDIYQGAQDAPTVKIYSLKSKGLACGGEIKILDESESQKFDSLDFKNRKIIFKGKEYQVTWQTADFIYEDTSMLNFIYQKLKRKLKDYFEKQ